MMHIPPTSEISASFWTPLFRAELEALLARHAYTALHLGVLYWLIWLSLLSEEELFRVLAHTEESPFYVETRADLSTHLESMRKWGLIDTVTLHEPALGRERRYYVTDLGLHLYLCVVRPSLPLSLTRLARSYPITRDDLLASLARPHLHRACLSLATRFVAEGEPQRLHLVSYQQPWQRTYTFAHTRYRLVCDAALLIQQTAGATYAFLVQGDIGPHQKAEREVEKFLLSLLDLRQSMLLYRQSWPGLLIITTRDRLATWARLLSELHIQRSTKPLAGGITTLEALSNDLSIPIWRDLVTLASTEDLHQVPLLSLPHLLRDPASAELVEQFSRQHHLHTLLLKEAASPPARLKRRLTRVVGDSLQEEAEQMTLAHLEALFAQKRESHHSREGAGLLTLALTATEKEILTWAFHHPLLDLPTLLALLRPGADAHLIKPLQQTITHLFQLGLLETRVWSAGKTSLEQQRYLLTPTALKFLAIRHSEPLSFSFVSPKYQKGDDEQLDRQWGTRGLAGQMRHTHGLYTFMARLYQSTSRRGEVLYQWKSAHEAARWYQDTLSQEAEHTRPDAELVFALSPDQEQVTMILLEYDRGTMSAQQYIRKFQAYLDYQQATGRVLPLLVVTVSQKAAQRMQQVLDELPGTLHLAMLLEHDLLTQGLTLVLQHFPP